MQQLEPFGKGLNLVVKELGLPNILRELMQRPETVTTWAIDQLKGVTCPKCREIGTILRIRLGDVRNISLPTVPGQSELDKVAWFEKQLELDFGDSIGNTAEEIRLGVLKEQGIAEQRTRWTCFSCRQEIPAVEFVDQFEK